MNAPTVNFGGTMRKILIVEDEKHLQELIQMSIDDLGEFLIAGDLAQAQALIDEHKDIAVVTLDGNIPGGGESPNTQVLIPKLLAMGAVIIAMSGDSNETLMEKGAQHLVGKPYSVAKLREIVSLVK